MNWFFFTLFFWSVALGCAWFVDQKVGSSSRDLAWMVYLGLSGGVGVFFWLGLTRLGGRINALERARTDLRNWLTKQRASGLPDEAFHGELCAAINTQRNTTLARVLTLSGSKNDLTLAPSGGRGLWRWPEAIAPEARGLFVSLGVLFTFFGLVAGLSSLQLGSATEVSALQDRLGALLPKIGLAFKSSFLGVSLSLLSQVLFKRYKAQEIDAEQALLFELDGIRTHDDPARLLKQLHESQLHGQKALVDRLDLAQAELECTSALITRSNELHTKLHGVIEQLTTDQLALHKQALDEVMLAFEKRFADALRAILSAQTHEFISKVEQLLVLQHDLTRAFEPTVSTFTSGLTSYQDALKEYQAALAEHHKQRGVLKRLSDSFERGATQHETFNTHTEQLVQHTEQLTQQQQTVLAGLSGPAQTLQVVSADLQRLAAETQTTLATIHKQSVVELKEAQRLSAMALVDQLDQLNVRGADELREQLMLLDTAMAAVLGRLQGAMVGELRTFNQQVEEMARSVQATHQALQSPPPHIIRALEQLDRSTQALLAAQQRGAPPVDITQAQSQEQAQPPSGGEDVF